MEEKDWLLVSALLKLLGGVSHQQSVTIVDWVTELEDKDGISAHILEFLSEFKWSLTVVIETVVPFHALKGLNITTGEPVTLFVDHFDVWVILGVDTPGTGTTLLFTVSEELRVAEDGQVLALVGKSDGSGTVKTILILC